MKQESSLSKVIKRLTLEVIIISSKYQDHWAVLTSEACRLIFYPLADVCKSNYIWSPWFEIPVQGVLQIY